ncbi:hypothetical protein SAMN04487911_1427 [Arenibacter nanhaiticus]|uniref:Uncharacterized protein n=1 Tax=Arenibacter nanhaiticus TaxID=558155 RepID=A0A1M6MI34_9FLAO|nr:hypothetical protein SAMN04487911_1427 [Arenibacter nanhaiticus]
MDYPVKIKQLIISSRLGYEIRLTTSKDLLYVHRSCSHTYHHKIVSISIKPYVFFLQKETVIESTSLNSVDLNHISVTPTWKTSISQESSQRTFSLLIRNIKKEKLPQFVLAHQIENKNHHHTTNCQITNKKM